MARTRATTGRKERCRHPRPNRGRAYEAAHHDVQRGLLLLMDVFESRGMHRVELVAMVATMLAAMLEEQRECCEGCREHAAFLGRDLAWSSDPDTPRCVYCDRRLQMDEDGPVCRGCMHGERRVN